MIISKQSSNRNLKVRGSKLKLALQICLLLAICIWLVYQAKQFSNRENSSNEQASEGGKDEYQLLKLGRKNLNPRFDELETGFQKEEMQVLEDEEIKIRENEEADDSAVGKTEEGEHEQLEDLIDEDDNDD